MGSLKIAFFTDTFLPTRDGVVSSTLNFKKELERRGHEVYVFASGDRKSEEIAKRYKNVQIMRGMRLKRYPQYNIAIPNPALMMTISDIDPDIIHAQTPFSMGTTALAMAKINKIPIVSTFHTLFPDTRAIRAYVSGLRANRVSRYAWSYARFFYNRCNCTMALTEPIRAVLEKKGIKNMAVVPNGIDVNRFNERVSGKRVRRSLGLGKDERMVLYLGRISKEKRLETLLGAARYLDDDTRIVVCGTGPALDYYENLARRLGVARRTDFLGFIDEAQVSEYYAAADIFCIPSTFEILCTTALEAFAVGTPVVAAESIGFQELVRNGKNGEKFAPGDSKSCASKIKKVLNNADSYKATRSTALQYSNEVATEKLLSVYQDVLKKFTL